MSASVVAFPLQPIKPDVDTLLPILLEVPDGSEGCEELLAIVIHAGRWLEGLHGKGASPATLKEVANALFTAYWASAQMLGMLPEFKDPDDIAG